jgi:hypothetical protein
MSTGTHDGSAEASKSPVAGPKTQMKRRCHECRRSCRQGCGPCCSLFLIAFVLFPIALFTISALFALPLWAIECSDAAPEDEALACSYYDWFKYIMSNLTALATPLTEVRSLMDTGQPRVRSHCRFVLPLIHFIPDFLRDSVAVFLTRSTMRPNPRSPRPPGTSRPRCWT